MLGGSALEDDGEHDGERGRGGGADGGRAARVEAERDGKGLAERAAVEHGGGARLREERRERLQDLDADVLGGHQHRVAAVAVAAARGRRDVGAEAQERGDDGREARGRELAVRDDLVQARRGGRLHARERAVGGRARERAQHEQQRVQHGRGRHGGRRRGAEQRERARARRADVTVPLAARLRRQRAQVALQQRDQVDRRGLRHHGNGSGMRKRDQGGKKEKSQSVTLVQLRKWKETKRKEAGDVAKEVNVGITAFRVSKRKTTCTSDHTSTQEEKKKKKRKRSSSATAMCVQGCCLGFFPSPFHCVWCCPTL